jgi:acetyl-CoA C-acetyltransferase
MAHCAQLAEEIVPVEGLQWDAYPRAMRPAAAARLPVQAVGAQTDAGTAPMDCAVSTLAISTRADGAAMVLLMTEAAARKYGVRPAAQWRASASLGQDPAMPLLAAEAATLAVLQRTDLQDASSCEVIELHDAFAVQGLSYCAALGLSPDAINRLGGGIARGHPIGASGAIALVRVLADLQRLGRPGALGLAAVAGAGGIGAATLVEWLGETA